MCCHVAKAAPTGSQWRTDATEAPCQLEIDEASGSLKFPFGNDSQFAIENSPQKVCKFSNCIKMVIFMIFHSYVNVYQG